LEFRTLSLAASIFLQLHLKSQIKCLNEENYAYMSFRAKSWTLFFRRAIERIHIKKFTQCDMVKLA